MNKLYFIPLIVSALWTTANAQVPQEVTETNTHINTSLLACPPGQQNDAGTFNLGQFIGQSNDTDLDTIYLCFGDSIFIDHVAGSQNLTGDPVPATPAGVGYALYTCPPVISGPDKVTIETDPCRLMIPPPPFPLVVSAQNRLDGDQWFTNSGVLQNLFNGGNPLLLYFAPVTFDALDLNGIPTYEGNPAGPCVNVNTADAFAVVYLNTIQIDSIDNNSDGGGCEGMFQVTGGLPEYDGSRYTVDVSLVSDTSVKAHVSNPNPFHGSTVRFNVYEPGLYIITVTDDKNCMAASSLVNMTGCSAIQIDITDGIGETGDTVCVDLVVNNFDSIASFQFSMLFDTSVARFLRFTNVNDSLGLGQLFVANFPPNSGILRINWPFFSPFPATVLNGESLFSLCFELVGNDGDCSDLFVSFDPNLVLVEFKDAQQRQRGIVPDSGLLKVQNLFPPLNVMIDSFSVSCFANPDSLTRDGAFQVKASGGTPPYEILWQELGMATQGPFALNNAGDSILFSDLPAGTYAVTVTDALDSISIDTFLINTPPDLGVGPNVTNPLCFGDSTGSFNIMVAGGTPNYTFLWNNDSTTQNLNNIPSGFYAVTVTDANGCIALASGTLFNPPQLALTVSSTDAACTGIDNGSATANPIGGTVAGNYQYQWDTNPVSNTQTINNLAIGRYRVTVTDDNGCSIVDSVDIGAATILELQTTTTDISCFGAGDGSIVTSRIVTGVDNGGYNYIWNPLVAGNGDTAAVNLGPGTYNLMLNDAQGCNIDTSFTINEPDSITITVTDIMDESCLVGNDGFIVVSATGGTIGPGSDYQYDWSNSGMTNTISGLAAGTYTVTVTDDNNCEDSLSIVILAPTPPIIDSFNVQTATCSDRADGAASVFASPGGAPITTIQWSNGSNGNSINAVLPGLYVVTVTAQDGCETVDSVTIGAPAPLQIIDTLVRNPSCAGSSDGQLAVTMAGGTGPYQFSWTGGRITNPIFALSAGTYEVTVTDANNCPEVTATLTLTDPPLVSVNFDPGSISPVSCFEGVCDGTASATATGGGAGTGRYTFTWASGETDISATSSSASMLCKGWQTLTVADSLGCFTIDSVFIDSPDSIALDSANSVIQDVSCNGLRDGSISVAVMGGTDPYTFFWPFNGTAGPSIAGIPAGNYDVQITDGNTCMQTLTIQVQEPEPFVAFIEQLTDVTCAGGTDGSVRVGTMGGNAGPRIYNWLGNIAPPDSAAAAGLVPGAYSVTVTDINGCEAIQDFDIMDPPPIIFSLPPIPPPACFGDRTVFQLDTVFGGNGPTFTISIDNRGQNFANQPVEITGGEHLISIFDSKKCRVDTTVFVDEPPPVSVSLGPDIEVELGATATLQAQVNVLLPIDTVLWTLDGNPVPCQDSIFGNCLSLDISPSSSGRYGITVIDINGCRGSDELFVKIDKNRNVFIPNVFSPNGDGFNDFFEIFAGVGVEEVLYFRVYDRWGELLYEQSNFQPGDNSLVKWNGTFRGKLMNPGVYLYLANIRFLDGQELLYRGTVTLVR